METIDYRLSRDVCASLGNRFVALLVPGRRSMLCTAARLGDGTWRVYRDHSGQRTRARVTSGQEIDTTPWSDEHV